ncbi:MAG: hypothetical protein H0V45_02840 [Actinobacteria bacterium]|nr:hypothetical protein [Actinomycetota bacterium]
MRKTVLILLGCLLALPAAAAASPDRSAGDGALSVADGRGQIVLQARGGVIGRFDRGCVTITDLTPEDLNFPWVWGDDLPPVESPRGGVRYCGQAVRFRLIGGKFRIVVAGVGIDLSAVGVGDGTIVADDSRLPGVYSLEGDDCRSPRATCKPLPAELQRFKLGTPTTTDKSEKSTQRVGP